METIAYTVSGTTTEVSLGALGVGLTVKFKFGTHGESTCLLPLSTIPPETAPAIPFEARCVIYTGRAGGPSVWTGGSILFQGRRTDNSGQASGTEASQELVIEDAWYDLRLLTLQAVWQNITGFTGLTPTYGTPYTWPDCVLFQASPGGQLQPGGSFTAYSPLPAYSHITTGQSIEEMLAYAIYIGGANLQIGTLDPACYLPFYPVRSMRCADAIKIALRPHPDCACEIDYTTTPPTFNIRKLSNLTPLTMPYKGSSGNKMHVSSNVRPRPELQVPRVAIYLKTTTTINGNDVVSVSSDIYPGGASSLRSLDVSLDMSGPKLAVTNATLTTASFNPASLAWWAAKVPALKSVTNGGQIPASGAGALAILDTTINGGGGHLKGIQVLDDSGNPINLTTYAYELTQGTPAAWMGVNVVEANVVAFFSYNKQSAIGTSSANLVDQVGEHMHTTRIKLINVATTTFSNTTYLATGEIYPGGLAQSIYTALQPLQYSLTHQILESPFATVVKPGKHCLNLSGGASAWSTMNTMIQSVDLALTFNPGNSVTTATTTIHCGPVSHLEAGELLQIFNLFTNRNLSQINPNERAGISMSGGSVTLGNDGPKENSVPAIAIESIKNFSAPDATAGGITNLLAHDATQGQISRTQYNTSTGAVIAAGVIAPMYNGAGAPAAGTLAATAYYRISDRYLNTVSNAEYICTTAGSNSTSIWAQLSGTSTAVWI